MSPRDTPVGSAFYVGNRWPVYIQGYAYGYVRI